MQALREIYDVTSDTLTIKIPPNLSYPKADPLEKFIGAFNSNIPDWADEHDKYLGQSFLDKHEEP